MSVQGGSGATSVHNDRQLGCRAYSRTEYVHNDTQDSRCFISGLHAELPMSKAFLKLAELMLKGVDTVKRPGSGVHMLKPVKHNPWSNLKVTEARAHCAATVA